MHVLTATPACTGCTNGLLVFMTRHDDGSVFLQCDECLAVYPDVLDGGEPVREGSEWDVPGETSSATRSAIRARGWGPLIDRRSVRPWLTACPHGDGGVLRPLVTASGRVVLLCDRGREAWLDPSEVSAGAAVHPQPPSWRVADGVHVQPRTTRWASGDELPEAWAAYAWHDG